MTVNDLIQSLRYSGLRVRTALWLLPAADLSHLPDKAARLGVDLADVRQPLLKNVAPQQRFLGLGVRECVEALDTLCQDIQATDCIVVANFDLLVARLSYQGRKELWQMVFNGFPYRPRALLLAMPSGAAALLPDELESWRKDKRLVT